VNNKMGPKRAEFGEWGLMYCQICGSESTQGLNYCKRCGASLTVTVQAVEAAAPRGLTGFPFALTIVGISIATAIVALGGLGIVLAVVTDLARSPTAGDLAKMILVLGVMMISAISGLLVWQVSRLLSLPRVTSSTPLQPQRPARPAPLPLAGVPPAGVSVTENTTRSFDPSLYREPGANE
jgi:hypothetical protein